MGKIDIQKMARSLKEIGKDKFVFPADTPIIKIDLKGLTFQLEGIQTSLKCQNLFFGGERYYIRCPVCGKYRNGVYRQNHKLLCGFCLGLHDRTLKRSKNDCRYYFEQATKEARKVDPSYIAVDYITRRFPSKPKGMHWRTYERHRKKDDAYFSKGEALWMKNIKI